MTKTKGLHQQFLDVLKEIEDSLRLSATAPTEELMKESISESLKKMRKYKAQTNKTKMKVIAKKYGVDFGEDNDMELGEFLKKRGYKSLAELLKQK